MKHLFTFIPLLALMMSATAGWGQQDFYGMSTGNYSQNFADIDNWTNNYAAGIGASNWRVATNVATSTVNTFAVFVTGTTGGIQKGTESLVLLAAGTNSTATDLLLNFTGRSAGTISLDWAKVVNTASASPRSSDLKIQYSIDDGVTFTDLTGYTLPRVSNNNTAESGSLTNIILPSALNNISQVVIRFYVWNNGQTGGSGNRPKIAIDNVSVTSTALVTPTITLNLSSLTGFIYVHGAGPSSEQTFTVSGTNLTDNISIAASTNYEISLTSGSGYTTPIVLTQSGGNVSSTTIYVRLKAGLSAGSYNSEEITATSTGASDKTVTCSGTVTSPPLYYRSKATGNWGDAASWETSSDNSSWIDASASPTSADDDITVRTGHTITVTSSVTIDETVIEAGGQLTINSLVTLTVVNGAGTDLVIAGTVLNSGSLTISSSTWQVSSGGTYIHNTTSGIATPLNAVTLDVGSNFKYLGSSSLTPATSISNRTYSNLIFESTSGIWSTNFGAGTNALTVNGKLTIGENVNWTMGSFTGNLNFNGDIDVYGSLSVTSFTVGIGKTCIIYPNGRLGFSGTLTNSGSLTIKSDNTGTGSLITNGSVTGNIVVERYIPGASEQWHLVSSPVSEQGISGGWTPDGSYPDGSGYDFYAWHEAGQLWVNRKNTTVSPEGEGPRFDDAEVNGGLNFNAAKGYLTAFQAATLTKSFTGAPFNSTQTYTLSKSGIGSYVGLNLVGNPFPSTIAGNNSADATNNFLAANASVLDDSYVAYYYLDNGNYTAINQSSSAHFIAVGQGLFVVAKNNAGSLSFNTNIRKHGSSTFYKNSDDRNALKIHLQASTGKADATELFFQNDMTTSLDPGYDAAKLLGFSGVNVYTKLVAGGNTKFDIQALPIPNDNMVVALGLTVTEAGTYNFTFEPTQQYLNSIPQTFLLDKLTNTQIQLSPGSSYGFTIAEAGDFNNRFELRFGALNIIDKPAAPALLAHVAAGQLHVFNLKGAVQLEIYDLAGRRLQQHSIMADGTYTRPLALPAGVYVVRATSEQSSKAVKVIVQ